MKTFQNRNDGPETSLTRGLFMLKCHDTKNM